MLPVHNTALRVFKSQYLQLVPVLELVFPQHELLRNIDAQQWLHDELFDQNESSKYLPPSRYQLQVLKKLVGLIQDAVEDSDQDEISDDLSNALAELMSQPVPSEIESVQKRVYVTYTFSQLSDFDTQTITILESRNVIYASGTTGLRTWEASLHLASYVASPFGKDYVHDKRVLELGAGTGLLSIFCAKSLNPNHVLVTDGSSDVVDALPDNLFLNGLESSPIIGTRILKWGRPLEEDEDGQEKQFDTVLGADITYDSTLFPYLLSTLRMCFESNPNLTVLISATIRNETTFSDFQAALKSARLSIEFLPFNGTEHGEYYGPFYSLKIPIHIMRITPEPGVKFDLFAIK